MNGALWLALVFAIIAAAMLPQWRFNFRERGYTPSIIIATAALVLLFIGLMKGPT